ncbi:MAG: hypothetical protein CBHOC_1711 [uncultured Caballeronia sp.]|nr:MAG: hypothetical protein CBHOC_1711 [uncultured Caballeronia sp.]
MLAGGKLRPMGVRVKLGVSGQSVHNWAYTWHEQGVIGLLLKIGDKGRRATRTLSDEMVASVMLMTEARPEPGRRCSQVSVPNHLHRKLRNFSHDDLSFLSRRLK